MNRFLLLCLCTCFYHTLAFAEDLDSKNKVKTALATLKEHLNKSQPLNKNPLSEFNLQDFESQAYLFYYRALGNVLVAKHKKESEKISYLNQALSDLKLAQISPHFDSKLSEQLSNTILKEKIEIAFLIRDFKSLIDAIEALPRSDQAESRYILYYGFALFNTSQTDDFKRLVKKYLSIFRDKNLAKTHLQNPPDWDSVIEIINDDTTPTKQIFSPKITLNKSMNPSDIDILITANWKNRDLKKAEQLSKSFLKHKWHPLYSKVLFNMARIQEDGKKYPQSAATYKRFLQESDDLKLYELAQFRHAWVWHLSKNEKKSKPLFEEYLKNYPDGRYASTAEYFLLQFKSRQIKNHAEKERLARNYIDTYPLSFYSIRLMDELNLKNDELMRMLSSENNMKTIEDQYNTFKADIATLSQLSVYEELLEFGLKDEAAKVLKRFPFDSRNDLFTLYLAAQFNSLRNVHGEESNLVRVFTNFEQFRKYIPWKGLFPDYRLDTIRQEIQAQNLDISPFLVLSIIRQESAFDPEAQSSANAQGLMQLTLGTAKEAADDLQVKTFSLLNENDNLKLGIKTISYLLKKYNNRLDYALCGYNAGETATQLWIDLRGDLQPVEFIESIPYQETRTYVKNVLRNYAVYRILYDKRPKSLISYNLPSDPK